VANLSATNHRITCKNEEMMNISLQEDKFCPVASKKSKKGKQKYKKRISDFSAD